MPVARASSARDIDPLSRSLVSISPLPLATVNHPYFPYLVNISPFVVKCARNAIQGRDGVLPPGPRGRSGTDQRASLLRVSGSAVIAPCHRIASSRLTREWRSEEHTSELQSLMRISYAVFCLK